MKTLALLTTMLLTTAFAHLATAGKVVPCSGFLVGTEASQFLNGVIVLDGTASGSSSLGKFTYSYHGELDPIHLTAVESGQLTFTNGETVNVDGYGMAENSGLTGDAGDLASVTELLHFTSGTGRFVAGLGGFVVQHSQLIARADYATLTDTYASFKGYYVTSGDSR